MLEAFSQDVVSVAGDRRGVSNGAVHWLTPGRGAGRLPVSKIGPSGRVSLELLFPRVFTEKRKQGNGSSNRRGNDDESVVVPMCSLPSFFDTLVPNTHSREST